MSPEAERAAEVRDWLTKAALDLRGAQIDLRARPPPYGPETKTTLDPFIQVWRTRRQMGQSGSARVGESKRRQGFV